MQHSVFVCECVCECESNYLKYSNYIVRYLFLWEVNPWASTVEMLLKEVTLKFISQADAGYQKIQKDLTKIISSCIIRYGSAFCSGLCKLLKKETEGSRHQATGYPGRECCLLSFNSSGFTRQNNQPSFQQEVDFIFPWRMAPGGITDIR